MHAVMLLQLD